MNLEHLDLQDLFQPSRIYLLICYWHLREVRTYGTRYGDRVFTAVVAKYPFEYDKRHQAFNDVDGVRHLVADMATLLDK